MEEYNNKYIYLPIWDVARPIREAGWCFFGHHNGFHESRPKSRDHVVM